MKCPGQDSRYWKPGAIFEAECPKCGHEVEFFKDDTTRRCKGCGHRFLNPAMDFGCASYCRYAEQCIGNLSPELIAQKQDLLKDRVAVEMKRHFGRDFKRIGHATRVARYAERIGREEGGNPAVILVAAYLHDLGIRGAEKGPRGREADHEGQEGPAVARDMLTRLGAADDLIEEVCDIIGPHRHPSAEETIQFRCVHDADRIARLEHRQKKNPMDAGSLDRLIDTSFLTESGKKMARRILLPGDPPVSNS